PDFNPIEEVFSSIKAFLHQHEGSFTPERLLWLIMQAVIHITPEMAQGWFRDCGYM
ncbi:hypothetical protein B0H17DRAFT_927831, partial [Mycena rosella]